MIRHILKKDFRLLWPFAALIAIVPFVLVVVDIHRGHFERDDSALNSLLFLLEIMFYAGGGGLILTLIHQDSLVGMRQDWLVRPIRRRDLLLAKLVFVAAAVQLPLLIAMTAEGLLDGFTLQHALLPALTENLWLLAAFALPVLAIGSLTRSLTESLAVGIAVFAALLCVSIVLKGMSGGNPLGPTGNTAIAWIPDTAKLLIFLAGSAAILTLQYFGRRTRTARILLAFALLVGLAMGAVPWNLTYRGEEAMSNLPAAADSVAISFDGALGRYRSPAGDIPHLQGIAFSEGTDAPVLYVPLRFQGIPAHSKLRLDHVVAYINLPGSRDHIRLSNPDSTQEVEIANDPMIPGTYMQYQRIAVRPGVYARAKNREVTLELDFSATLLQLSSENEFPSAGGNQRLASIGWCQSRLNEAQTQTEVYCLDTGYPAQCATFFLKNPATGAHNPAVRGCRDSYSPWFGRYKPIDTVTFTGANLPFQDSSGLLQYPVNGSQISESVVVIWSAR